MQQKGKTYNLKPTYKNRPVSSQHNVVRGQQSLNAPNVERIEVPAAPIEVVSDISNSSKVRKKKKSLGFKPAKIFSRVTAVIQNGLVDLIKGVFLTGLIVRRLHSLILNKIAMFGEFLLDIKHYFAWKKNKDVPRGETALVLSSNYALAKVEKFEAFDKNAKNSMIALATGVNKAELDKPIDEKVKYKIFKALTKRSLRVYLPLACLVLISAVLYSVKDYTLGVKLYVDEEAVAILKDEEDYADILSKVSDYISAISGKPYSSELAITFEAGLVKRDEVGSYSRLEELLLLEATDVVKETNALYVDGELIAANDDKEALELLLDEILWADCTEGQKADFIQDIRIETAIVPNEEKMDIEAIRTLLTSTVSGEQTYEVERSDVLGTIAPKFDMTVTELRALNPEVSDTQLYVGTELIVAKERQFLSTKVMETFTYMETVAYQTEYVDDPDMYTYNTKTLQNGKDGEVEVLAEAVYIDGVEYSSNVLSRTVITEPTTRIIAKGTKTPPPKSPTGTFTSPVVGGVVSSRYGVYRGGGSYHTGLDIALPTGSTIVASDGGVVTYAGWNGGYGYLVTVTHANGYETRYAHCSQILVKVGQQVGKGEPIAKVGSTGNSTGPHIHFEIRINGNTVNPAPYIGR